MSFVRWHIRCVVWYLQASSTREAKVGASADSTSGKPVPAVGSPGAPAGAVGGSADSWETVVPPVSSLTNARNDVWCSYKYGKACYIKVACVHWWLHAFPDKAMFYCECCVWLYLHHLIFFIQDISSYFLQYIKPELEVTSIKQPTCLKQPLFVLPLCGCLTQVWL